MLNSLVCNNIFVLSFCRQQTEHGDSVDCIDIYKRRAFNHPMLKNHTIQVYDQLFMCLLQCPARELLALIYWCGLHTPVTGS